MENKSGMRYEEAGDSLKERGCTDEARAAYIHAMGDYTRPMDLAAYRRVLRKLTALDETDAQAEMEPTNAEIHASAAALGRRKSAAKAAAARENGRKGGRPRKDKDAK